MKERPIAKNQNTFAKRQREMEKKYKQQEKLNRRLERKQAQENGIPQAAVVTVESPDDSGSADQPSENELN